jgi:hypothetical protein
LTRRIDAATPTTLLKERVAQLVEHLTFNQEVMGSNPIALTNETNMLEAQHQTKHPAEINQGNNWGNATNRPAAAPPLSRRAKIGQH